MYATFDTRSPDELAAEPAFVEAYAMIRLGDNRATTLALWTTTTDPGAYAVLADQPGPAADGPAAAATVVWFDGPMSPARHAAAEFGYRERIAPALAAVPGHVRTLTLWRERDAASCAVNLAVDLPALEACGAAINATELLPGEDPALLTGPDRVDIHHTTAHTRPTEEVPR
jgi:hypothetical protein